MAFTLLPCHLLMTNFHQWTSGIYIRLSNNFAKRAGKWGAQSQLITTITVNSLHMFANDLSKANFKNVKLYQIGTPPWYVIVGRHPRIRLAMACVSKGWEECHTNL